MRSGRQLEARLTTAGLHEKRCPLRGRPCSRKPSQSAVRASFIPGWRANGPRTSRNAGTESGSSPRIWTSRKPSVSRSPAKPAGSRPSTRRRDRPRACLPHVGRLWNVHPDVVVTVAPLLLLRELDALACEEPLHDLACEGGRSPYFSTASSTRAVLMSSSPGREEVHARARRGRPSRSRP